jgi:hypothetical protein
MRVGIYVYGIASIAAGILDLIWGEFDPAHQPLQAWGDHIPGVTILAYIAAVWLIAAGAAILWHNSERFGAAALAILYGIFILFPLPRFYTAPHYVGYGIAVYIGVLSSVCQQIILCVAAAIVWRSLVAGCAVAESGSPRSLDLWALLGRFRPHALDRHPICSRLCPEMDALGGTFWTVLTGIAFVLAGLAIISGVLDVLAAQLLGLMLLIFSLLVLTPMIFASPHDHVPWGANAYNLTAVGAAWMVADWLAMGRQPVPNQQSVKPALA